MRNDLPKVFSEHERRRSSLSFKQVRRAKAYEAFGIEGDGQSSHESMRFRHHKHHKSASVNLKPLLGQVRKHVGKRWDDFYSELCRTFDMRSPVNHSVLDYLDGFCERRIVIQDDELFVQLPYLNNLVPLKGYEAEFYVDPRDGVIKRNTERKTYKQQRRERDARLEAERAAVFRKLDEYTVLRKIDGAWFLFTLKDLPDPVTVYDKPRDRADFYPDPHGPAKTWAELTAEEKERLGVVFSRDVSVRDCFTGEWVAKNKGHLSWYAYKAAGSLPAELKGKYHASKRTASKKDLRRAGLI